jgi:anthranilate synthase/aminodeoxychorismate synthase-like glutamine amidotransferase
MGADICVYRNDAITLQEIEKLSPEKIVISPGPCTPLEAGLSNDVIRHFGKTTPILGVCLGHQCIGHVFGSKIVHAKRLMHGKTSDIAHDGQGVFKNLPNPFQATRYHSLVIDPSTIDPAELVITARSADDPDEIMGVRHTRYPIHGVQFHPESILTTHGKDLLRNFLQLS